MGKIPQLLAYQVEPIKCYDLAYAAVIGLQLQ